MPSTNVNFRRRTRQNGFTLVELMMALFVSLIVFAALFSAYIFIARNTTRISYAHQQALQSSRILHFMSIDVGSATQVVAASNQRLVLQLPDASQVTYTYTPATQSLQRSGSGPTIVLTGIMPLPLEFSTPSYSSNIFNYYNQAGSSLLPAPGVYPPPNVIVPSLVDIRQIELGYLSTEGFAGSGTQSRTNIVSSRMILRNKLPLGQ